ncbi:MAG TPA: AI-2E family transporter [Candidatus Saccharimonadales bacterium]|nr:AI-2E family transporter [Candidatus Saccharimonadales bacterium]
MSSYAVTGSQKRALGIATALAILIGIYFLRGYFLLIAFAAIVAFTFNPFYQRLLRRGRRPGTAASLTFLLSLLALIVPLTIVILVSVHQILLLVHNIAQSNYSTNLSDLLKHFVDACNRTLASLHISYRLSVNTLTSGLSHTLNGVKSTLLNTVASSVSSFFTFFSLAIIYIYVFLSMLTKQDVLLKTVHRLNPLGTEISRLYTHRMAAMTKAMVRGQFIIAISQGLTDALLLYLAGMHSTFFFFFLLLTVLSVIPLGGGIVAIPIGIVMLFTGNVLGGLLIIIGHLIIVTNIDNVLRPKLVPAEARLDPALTLLAVFSGLRFFGFLGIIIGPVLMILLVTTIQIFMEVYRDVDAVGLDEADKGDHPSARRRSRFLFWRKKS